MAVLIVGWMGYKRFLKETDDARWKDEAAKDCVAFAYRSRIAELQIQSGQLQAADPVRYVCQGDESRPFYAAFYQQTYGRDLRQRYQSIGLDPDNLAVLTNHLACAAFELPFEPGESFGGFAEVEEEG